MNETMSNMTALCECKGGGFVNSSRNFGIIVLHVHVQEQLFFTYVHAPLQFLDTTVHALLLQNTALLFSGDIDACNINTMEHTCIKTPSVLISLYVECVK